MWEGLKVELKGKNEVLINDIRYEVDGLVVVIEIKGNSSIVFLESDEEIVADYFSPNLSLVGGEEWAQDMLTQLGIGQRCINRRRQATKRDKRFESGSRTNRYLFGVTRLSGTQEDITIHALSLSEAWFKAIEGKSHMYRGITLLEADNIPAESYND